MQQTGMFKTTGLFLRKESSIFNVYSTYKKTHAQCSITTKSNVSFTNCIQDDIRHLRLLY